MDGHMCWYDNRKSGVIRCASVRIELWFLYTKWRLICFCFEGIFSYNGDFCCVKRLLCCFWQTKFRNPCKRWNIEKAISCSTDVNYESSLRLVNTILNVANKFPEGRDKFSILLITQALSILTIWRNIWKSYGNISEHLCFNYAFLSFLKIISKIGIRTI